MSFEESAPSGPSLVGLVVLSLLLAAAAAAFILERWLSRIRERNRINERQAALQAQWKARAAEAAAAAAEEQQRQQRQQAEQRRQRQQSVTTIAAVAALAATAFSLWFQTPDRNRDRTEQADQAERARRRARLRQEQQAADDAAISMGSNTPLRAAAAPGLPLAEQDRRRAGQPSADATSRSTDAGSHCGLPKPPVDTPGRWVRRAEFNGKKSFGWFECNCGRSWQSAYAETDKWQKCSGCARENYAELMWQNDRSVRRTSDSKARLDNGKPHRADLCEACLALGFGLGCWMNEEQRRHHLLRVGFVPAQVQLLLQRLNGATGR
jgi:hypothetical protein